MRVSVFGLGYVGTVSAACLSQQGHSVIGVDVNPQKVNLVNRGKSPIVERDVDELLAEANSQGRLSATVNSFDAVMDTDVSLICVGTPSKPNGSLNLDYVRQVASEIGHALRYAPEFGLNQQNHVWGQQYRGPLPTWMGYVLWPNETQPMVQCSPIGADSYRLTVQTDKIKYDILFDEHKVTLEKTI